MEEGDACDECQEVIGGCRAREEEADDEEGDGLPAGERVDTSEVTDDEADEEEYDDREARDRLVKGDEGDGDGCGVGCDESPYTIYIMEHDKGPGIEDGVEDASVGEHIEEMCVERR